MAKSKILIVEDEQIVAQDLRQSLQAQGYDVQVAADGEKGIEKATATLPNLVLLDIVLPGAIDGITAAEQFQQLNIPVIYITGHSNRKLFERARQTEPLAYLVKPLQLSELNCLIDLSLFKQQQTAERERDGAEKARALRESEERFRRVVEQVSDYCIFTLDISGAVTSWNSGAERTTGYTEKQILGLNYELFFSDEDRQAGVPALELEGARTTGSADDTRWLVRKGGEHYWAEGTLSAFHDSKGEVIGFSKVTRDTTQRRRMEDALKETNERLRVALHAARTGTWQWDIKTNVDTIDDSLRKLFGLRPDQKFEFIEDFYSIIHPDERDKVINAFQRTMYDGVHLDTEVRVVWPDGSEHWLLDQGEVTLDAQGNPASLTGACVDITERKKSEELLRQSEERFREFAANVRDYALLQLDAEGKVVSWNTGAEQVLGYSEPEILGKSVVMLFTPEDIAADEPQRELGRALTSGRSIDERWHMRKDGTRFWASGVLTSVLDGKGQVAGFAKVMRDESERRQSDERLRASLHEKGVLLQEIHHRVKNNLQVVTSLLRLQSEHVSDEQTQAMFEEARNRVQAIGGIHELLYRSSDLARIDFAAYLHRLTQDLFSFYGVSEDRLSLTIDVDNTTLEITEAMPCGLLVNELVTNALKHAFPNGRKGDIRVAMKCDRGQCVLLVEDNGVGLPEGFDWQHVGSLGLQLVQVLTSQLDGSVEVDGSSGTRIKIVFPPPAV